MRIIGYARVSSREQEKTRALEQQVERLKAAGATEIYTDVQSRSRSDRAGLNQVLELIRSRSVDEAIFVRVDRMTDSPIILEKAISICLESNIRIRGLDDALDFHTVGGRLHARILCNLARAEVERLAERVKHGHKYHRDRNAAYFAPFGYIKVGDLLELDHRPYTTSNGIVTTRALIARDMIEIFLNCKSLRKSLREINSKYGIRTRSIPGKGNRQKRGELHFGPSGFATWLNNPILLGHTCYGRTRHQRQSHEHEWDIRCNTHQKDRLMTDEEYRVIAEILSWNARHGGINFKSDKIHPLSGLIYCGECNGRCRLAQFRLRTDKSVVKYSYQCNNYHYNACDSKRSIREHILEQAIVECLIDRAAAIAAIAQIEDEYLEDPELQQLRKQLAGLEQLGLNPALEAAKADLRRQIENYQHSLQQQSHAQTGNHELLLKHFSDPLFWQTLLPEEKQQIYRQLIQRVIVRNGKVEQVIPKV